METKRNLMPASHSLPVTNKPDETGHKSERIERVPTIPDAAIQLGIDAFSLYGLIQRGAVHPERASGGKLFLPRPQIEMLLQGLAEDF